MGKINKFKEPATSGSKPKSKKLPRPSELSVPENLVSKSGQQESKGKGKAVAPASSSIPSKAIKKIKAFSPEPVQSEIDDHEEGSDSEDDGVDEEGMARLMKALGDDGLDELGQAELGALEGEEGDEDEESECDEEVLELGSDEGEEPSGEEREDESAGESIEGIPLSDGSSDEDVEDGEQADIPLDEVSNVDEDVVPRQKVEIDNKLALDQIRETVKLDSTLPWTETLVLSYPHTIDVDVDDDLNRELAFYKQALHGANAARALAAKHNFPFTRPADYFAEMVKSDAHMERIRIRLLNESSGIKKSEDKRKEREGKKFGKQVQIEKLKEREKSKKEMEERLKALKRKRKDVLDGPKANDEEFDVAVEDAISDRPSKRGKTGNGKSIPRSVRDKKFGFGGPGRRAKQNTKSSTDDFDSSKAGRGKKGAGGPKPKGGGSGRHSSKRLGKSRRQATRSK
ncbi:eukaryotic rRNA processing protein EBP2-domain-containing protein [Crepidotus variabilis]|uniref:Eukaryotic rRNA processing protein EBP2-domain-containing protein n=1 Tax=Crepidotus variabilis TaxID=179855 RepID=A0A9P6EEM2_9AGAR|nr:eukaryotic rRNA processing protein EBP2-domain-containing protein [Crepidotus variabilis]